MKLTDLFKNRHLKKLLSKLQEAHIAFVIISLSSGIFFVLNVPIGFDSDEGVHMLKATAISQGYFLSKPVGTVTTLEGTQITTYGSETLTDIANLEHATGTARATAECEYGSTCDQPTNKVKNSIQSLARVHVNKGNKTVVDLMGANIYNPIAYLPSAAFIKVGSKLSLPAGSLVTLARLGALLTFILLCFTALYALRSSNARWIIFCIALLPGSIVAASSVGTDSLLNGLALLLFAFIIRILADANISKTMKIALIGTGVLLPLIKLPYSILSAIILFLPIYTKGVRGVIQRVCTGVVLFIPALLWNLVTAGANATQSFQVHAGSTPPNVYEQVLFVLLHPLTYMTDLLKSFFTNDWIGGVGSLTHQINLQLPVSLLGAGLLLSLIAGVNYLQTTQTEKKTITKISIIISGLGVLGIATALYAAFNPVGASTIKGVQGRYFLPVLPFATIAIAYFLPLKTIAKKIPTLVIYGNTVILIVSCFWYYSVVY